MRRIAITEPLQKPSRSSSIGTPQLSRAVGVFFQVHDPSTRNRQGNDVGTSYRSAIFTTSDEQRRIAEDTIADVNASGLWPGPVVTEVTPAGAFWEAEPQHQDYLERIPNGYTCHFVRPGWKLPYETRPRPRWRRGARIWLASSTSRCRHATPRFRTSSLQGCPPTRPPGHLRIRRPERK